MKRLWFLMFSVAVLAGLGAAVFVGTAAWDHNPQGEFHDWETGAIQWDAFGPLIGLWFAIPFLSVSVVSFLVFSTARLVIRLADQSRRK